MLAKAMAERDVQKTVDSLRGEAGGAASRAGNTIQNIEEIAIAPNSSNRTAAHVRESIRQQVVELEKDIAEAKAKALASGIDISNVGVGRIGEMLAKGSKLDKAQQAAAKIGTYQQTVMDLRDRLAGMADLADSAIIPGAAEELAQQQAALRQSPYFQDVKENVLKNALAGFNRDAADAVAKRAVFQEALASQPAQTAKRAEELISGRAAKERLKQLGVRYGPPLVGSVAGGLVGSEVGGVAGGLAGVAVGGGAPAAIGALGGAGLRPALQALYRTATQYPAVRHGYWNAMAGLAETVPGMAQFADTLAQAAARGPAALEATDALLASSSPIYAEARSRAQQQVLRSAP
ncbi:hypothetical protein [Myxococcus landrumensis]|uniref:Uncharacterized protein n=1 Tax=Myxococcus landrumensis TaxID=2813577 RepID=A0ABX7N9E3_9BACT|nr:hypothetical protein [Myxococcus landrumus]QSQ14041.1 hypothetical protein JY572_37965 [Myxococcus landrumus]